MVESKAVAEDYECGIRCGLGQNARHQVRRRHQAVGVAVVLVDADAVEAEGVGVLELSDIVFVVLAAFFRVKVLVGEIDPGAAVLALEVSGEVLVGHQMEVGDFHRLLLLAWSVGILVGRVWKSG